MLNSSCPAYACQHFMSLRQSRSLQHAGALSNLQAGESVPLQFSPYFGAAALQDSFVHCMSLQHCMSLLMFKRLSQLVTRSNRCCATSAENLRASKGHW